MLRVSQPAPTLIDLCQRAAQGRGSVHHIARSGQVSAQSHASLWQRAQRVAGEMLRRNISPDRRPLPVLVDEPSGFLVLLWACVRTGIPAAPLPALPSAVTISSARDRLTACCRVLDAPLLCATHEQAELVRKAGLAPRGCISLAELESASESPQAFPSPAADDMAIVQFSSGSTRTPKGVRLTHANILANLRGIIQALDLRETSRIGSWFPYYHDFGLFGAHFACISAGVDEVHLEPAEFARNPQRFLVGLTQSRVTHTYSTATGGRLLLRSVRGSGKTGSAIDLSHVDFFCLGAEFISPSLVVELSQALAPFGLRPDSVRTGYGLAEAVLAVASRSWRAPPQPLRFRREALLTHGRAEPAAADDPDVVSFLDAGRPIDGCDVTIIDDAGEPLPPLRVGRIAIRGANVTSGYLGEARTVPAAWSNGKLDTGDLGLLTLDGLLVPVGRSKDLIVCNGRNVLPGDVEELVRTEVGSAWSEVIAVGAYDALAQSERLYLCYVPRPGRQPELQQLCARAARRVAAATGVTVDRFVRLTNADVPRTSSGKVIRYRLARQLLHPQPALEEMNMDNSTEQYDDASWLVRVQEAWRHALELSHLPPASDEDFFAIGGDSIRALRLLAALEDAVGGKLPLDFVYRHPVLAEQASALKARGDDICRSELEVLVRDIAAARFGVAAATISPTEPLMERAGGFAPVVGFAEEIRAVFGDRPVVTQALARSTVRDIAGMLHSLAPAEEADVLDLMPFQETLYYHSRSVMRNEPTGLSCYIVYRFDLQGRVDVATLEKAVALLATWHPMLRAEVDECGDRPRMRIRAALPHVPMLLEDISALSESAQEARLQAIDREDDDHRADLLHAPLFYLRVLRRSDNRWVVTMHFDHMLIDGFGLLELSKDLFDVYDALCLRRPVEPPAAALPSFALYVWIARLRALTSAYAADMEWHLKRFEDLAPRLDLPMTLNPAMLGEVRFATLHRRPPSSLLAGLRQYAAAETGVSLNALLLAGLFKLANVWSGQDDLILNMPVFNREHYLPAARRVIGSFIDIFPVRLKTGFGEPIASMARRLEAEIRALLSRPVSSIELSRRIAERQQVKGALSSLIFSNSINLVRREDLALATLRHERPPRVKTGAPGTWIDLVLYSIGEDWFLDWNYVRDLFDPAFVETLAEQYEAIMADSVAAWRTGQAERPFVSAAALPDRHRRLLDAINETDTPVAALTLHAGIQAQIAQAPDREAISFDGKSLTYRELGTAASRVAHFLREAGVGTGSFVAIALPRSIDLVAAQLGTMLAGAAYVPIDPSYPPERIGYMVQDCGAHVLVTAPSVSSVLREEDLVGVERLLLFGAGETAPLLAHVRVMRANRLDDYACSPPFDTAGTDDLAYMIYTSGSTGRPKGVMVSHRSFRNFVDHVLETFVPRGADERFALITSPSFDMTLASNWGPFLIGASLHVLSEERTRNPEALLRFLAEKRISLLNVTPSHFGLLAGALPFLEARPELHPAMMVLLGGERINVADCNLWLEHFPGHRIVNEYGPTETSVASSFFPIPVGPGGRVELDIVPIGKPIRNTQMYVLNADRQTCMVGVSGRLFIGGVGVARGYHNKPEQTAAAFVPDWITRRPGARLYDTGDMARVLEDGNIQFLGRQDRQVNLRGYRIELGEIETRLLTIAGIAQGCVVAQTDHRGQEVLAAYYVGAGSECPDAGDVREQLLHALPDYMVPSVVRAIPAMPLTPSGKVDVTALPAPDGGDRPQLPTPYVAPRTALEERLAAIWCGVLGLQTVGVDDSFWDVGGDSVRALRLIRAVNEAGYPLSLQDMFRAASVAATAELLESRGIAASRAAGIALISLRSVERPRLRLVCLPYAGGSPIMFRALADHLSADIAIDGVVYPGVEEGEPSGDVEQLARSLRQSLAADRDDAPVVLLGYCFGAYVAHATAALCTGDASGLRSVILSGATPPSAKHLAYGDQSLLGRLNDPETMHLLRRIYAPLLQTMTAAEQERYWGLYRASVEGMRDYRFPSAVLPWPCVVLTGAEEEYPLIHEHNPSWARQYAACAFRDVPGGHLMLATHPRAFAEAVASALDGFDGCVQ